MSLLLLPAHPAAVGSSAPAACSLPRILVPVCVQGLARSMPTSAALDRVADKLELPFFEVSTQASAGRSHNVKMLEIASQPPDHCNRRPVCSVEPRVGGALQNTVVCLDPDECLWYRGIGRSFFDIKR